MARWSTCRCVDRCLPVVPDALEAIPQDRANGRLIGVAMFLNAALTDACLAPILGRYTLQQLHWNTRSETPARAGGPTGGRRALVVFAAERAERRIDLRGGGHGHTATVSAT